MKSAGSRVVLLAVSGLIVIGLAAGLWSLRSKQGSRNSELSFRSLAASTTVAPTALVQSESPTDAEETVSEAAGKATDLPPATALPVVATEAPAAAVATSTLPAEPTKVPASPTPAANSSATQVACNLAVEGNPFHVTIPLDTRLYTGQAFRKTWGLKNAGDCGWMDSYQLVWVSGSRLDAPGTVDFGSYTTPGQSAQLSLDMVAPPDPGTYESRWMLRSGDGEVFGVGQANKPLVVRIIVTTPPTATAIPPSRLTGRVVFSGTPVAAGLKLNLEDTDQALVATTQTGSGGSFEFSQVAYDSRGYTLVFSQAENEQYEMSQVPSWVWLSKINPQLGATLQLPDLEISLLGFSPSSPDPDANVSLATITAANPLVFTWTLYPQATAYWVDLVLGDENSPVWQSSLTSAGSTSFNGLINGTPAQPGEYWWTVGARRELSGGMVLSIYGYFIPLNLEP